jgi:IclR family pca regulon transcriptional regulator
MSATEVSIIKPPRDFVGTVVHVMNVLRAFDADHAQMTLSELAKRSGLDRAGARRYLLSLAHLGYVVQSGKLFRLSPKVLELGFAFLSGMPIANVAQSYLDAITQQTSQTCAIAILDGNEIVHVARAMPTNRVLAPTVTLGRRFPALSVSSGRVLLAFKPTAEREQYVRSLAANRLTWRTATTKTQLNAELLNIRRRGYAIADQEFEDGVRAISVPILKTDDTAGAALNVVTNVSTVVKKRLTEEFLPLMRQAAADLQAAMVTI